MAFERCEIVWPASKWFYDGRKEPVTAESTDEEIAATAKLMEQEALAVGVRLDGAEEHLQAVRDELSDGDDCCDPSDGNVWLASEWAEISGLDPDVAAGDTDEQIAEAAVRMEEDAFAEGVRLEGAEEYLLSIREEWRGTQRYSNGLEDEMEPEVRAHFDWLMAHDGDEWNAYTPDPDS